MKVLTITLFLSILNLFCFAQHALFNEEYFREFEKRYKADAVACLDAESDPNLTLVNDDGRITFKENILQFYKDFGIANRGITDLTVFQVGNTGIATGSVNRLYLWKKDTTMRDWLDRFTYTFTWQKNKWTLISMQLTNLPNEKGIPYEEAALKKLLDEEAIAFSTADKKTLSRIWKDEPKKMFVGSNSEGALFSMNNEAMKNYIKNDLVPTGFTSVRANHSFNFKGNIVFVEYDQLTKTPTGQKIYQHNVTAFEKVGGEWKIILASIHGYNPTNKERNTEKLTTK
jgi:hypothetical protein